jgi:hypothetical protein
MKRCPQCNRTYSDDALSFCLDDGSPLVGAATPSFDPSATIAYPQSRETTPQPTIAYPSQAPPAPPMQQPAAPPPMWSPLPPAAPQKKSIWPWLLGIGAVLVFMGIGVVILIFAIANITNNNNNNSNSNTNRQVNRNTNRNSNANENSNTRSSLTSFSDDFAKEDWRTGSSTYGTMWYANEEYHMRGTKGYYFVIYSPDKADYKTKDATVRIGARSIDGSSPSTGYGLVVHGEMKNDNLEDYAFLIYNGDDPKYKIVDQKAGKDTTLVEWTSFSAIRTGTTPNQLEVRIRERKLDFYINGQFVTSIVDVENFQGGRVGLYTSDEHEVAFDDLEISR